MRAGWLLAASWALLNLGCRDLAVPGSTTPVGPTIRIVSPQPGKLEPLSTVIDVEVGSADGVATVQAFCGPTRVLELRDAPYQAVIDMRPCMPYLVSDPNQAGVGRITLLLRATSLAGASNEASVEVDVDTRVPVLTTDLANRIAPIAPLTFRVFSDQPLLAPPDVRLGGLSAVVTEVPGATAPYVFEARVDKPPPLGVDAMPPGTPVTTETLQETEKLVSVSIEGLGLNRNAARLNFSTMLSRVRWMRPVPGRVRVPGAPDEAKAPVPTPYGVVLTVRDAAGTGGPTRPLIMGAPDGRLIPFDDRLLDGGWAHVGNDKQGNVMLTRPASVNDTEFRIAQVGTAFPSIIGPVFPDGGVDGGFDGGVDGGVDGGTMVDAGVPPDVGVDGGVILNTRFTEPMVRHDTSLCGWPLVQGAPVAGGCLSGATVNFTCIDENLVARPIASFPPISLASTRGTATSGGAMLATNEAQGGGFTLPACGWAWSIFDPSVGTATYIQHDIPGTLDPCRVSLPRRLLPTGGSTFLVIARADCQGGAGDYSEDVILIAGSGRTTPELGTHAALVNRTFTSPAPLAALPDGSLITIRTDFGQTFFEHWPPSGAAPILLARLWGTLSYVPLPPGPDGQSLAASNVKVLPNAQLILLVTLSGSNDVAVLNLGQNFTPRWLYVYPRRVDNALAQLVVSEDGATAYLVDLANQWVVSLAR
ncbi:MAG: hypothetical protein ACKVPX_04785 [Myxococcaceae bacterium]